MSELWELLLALIAIYTGWYPLPASDMGWDNRGLRDL